MKNIVRHIEYLISRNDCVIIPGFGAILARKQCAKHDAASDSMLPPTRSFTFNRSLQDNDGQLAHSISRCEGISYANALNSITSYVEDLHRLLSNKGSVKMGLIGQFDYDAANNTLDFTPFDGNALSVDTCCLPTIRHRFERVADADTDYDEAKIVRMKTTPFKRFAKAAASIAVLIAVCFIASTPISVSDATLASMMPRISQQSDDALMPSDAGSVSNDTVWIDSEISGTMSEDTDCVVEYIDSEILSTYHEETVTEDRYVIVVGAFMKESEVTAFINQLSDPNLKYYKCGKLYRVYFGEYANQADAYRDFANSPYAPDKAWIGKK